VGGAAAYGSALYLAAALKSLLGREYQHAFLMPAAALTRRLLPPSGTLKAGSWLVLLTPDFPVANAARCGFSALERRAEPIPTPHFVHRFCQRFCGILRRSLASE
jgi:tRNA(Met) cytidine acetyltransferase